MMMLNEMCLPNNQLISRKDAKTQRKKMSQTPSAFTLRLCALA